MASKLVKRICKNCDQYFETSNSDTLCSDKCKREWTKKTIDFNRELMADGWMFSTCSKCGTELIYNCKRNCHRGCMKYKCPSCNHCNCKEPLKYYKPRLSTWDKKIMRSIERKLRVGYWDE